ncbi:alpha/beta hydrolase [Jackrogersella minutella]|nr:alpha/beta hydrolase [Jackrogersella minutella]
MYHFLKTDFFNFELIRVLGTAPFGGADIAECLDVASRVRDADPESWYDEWLAQAHKVETIANDACRNGDRVAARDAFIRCSNYYRAAQYMFNDRPEAPEPRVLDLSEKSVAYFRQALRLLDGEVNTLSIPYENGQKLPGYLYLPLPQKRLPGKAPILLVCGGADSTQEELYSLFPAAGIERGYAVVTYDGPGQGIVLRRDKLHMRPDWEFVVGRVLDHIFSVASVLDLDVERIAIAGASLGAYYALRGASDPRIAACVSIDPIYDMWDLATDRMPRTFISSWLSGWLSNGVFDTVWHILARFNFQLRWELEHCMWIFGVSSAALAVREMRRWTLRGEEHDDKVFLSRVGCPVLVSGASGTIYTRPDISTLRAVNDLSHLPEAQTEVWIAEAPGDGGLQAKVGAWRLAQQRTFKFLDIQMKISRPPLQAL